MLHWEEFIKLFNKDLTIHGELTLRDFSKIKFKTGEDASECYQKKMYARRALELDTKLMLEGLTDGLPRELKKKKKNK